MPASDHTDDFGDEVLGTAGPRSAREHAGPTGSGVFASGSPVRYEEQARVTNNWAATTRVRVQRRIVTEVQTLEVTVRREELIFTREPIPTETAYVYERGTAPVQPEPVTVVLHQEVPTVGLRVEPYERVTWGIDIIDDTTEITMPLKAERFEVVQEPATPVTTE